MWGTVGQQVNMRACVRAFAGACMTVNVAEPPQACTCRCSGRDSEAPTAFALGQQHAHASIDNGDVIIAPVRLLELVHILVRARGGDVHAQQDLVRLQRHLAIAQEELVGRNLQQEHASR